MTVQFRVRDKRLQDAITDGSFLHISEVCHRYDFLVRLIGTDLYFLNFLKLFHLGLITTPHVLYVHMTYV